MNGLQLTIGPEIVFVGGGVLAVAVALAVIWLIIRSLGSLIIWAILGGPSFYIIGGELLNAVMQGKEIQGLPLKLVFFLRPYDRMLVGTLPMTQKVCIFALLLVWFMIFTGWSQRFTHQPLFSASFGWMILWLTTETALGMRTFLSENLVAKLPAALTVLRPPLDSILLFPNGLLFLITGFTALLFPVIIYTIVTGQYKGFYRLPDTLSDFTLGEDDLDTLE